MYISIHLPLWPNTHLTSDAIVYSRDPVMVQETFKLPLVIVLLLFTNRLYYCYLLTFLYTKKGKGIHYPLPTGKSYSRPQGSATETSRLILLVPSCQKWRHGNYLLNAASGPSPILWNPLGPRVEFRSCMAK